MSPQGSRPTGNSGIITQPHPIGDIKTVAFRLVGGGVALWGLLALIGLLVSRVLDKGSGGSLDRSINVWFIAHRTISLNTATQYVDDLANTKSVVAITIVVVVLLRFRLGRWYESLTIITVVVGEVAVFVSVTLTVHRARPAVVRLDKSPPTSSFPSGHTGAALALYGAIAILLLWIYGRSWKTQIAAFLLFCIPIVVAVSRLYRGMHHPSDVIAGAICGGLWLLIVMSILLPRRKNMDFNNMPRTSLR
jgi:membrane-associated phospholipid phosphatase